MIARLAAVLAVMTATGCGAAAPASAPVPAEAPVLPSCPRAVDGVDALVAPGAVVLLGEVHGTEESPRFAGDVACHAARRGSVTVALEIPRDEQPRIDAFVASPGAAADRAALLAGGFWQRADQDGRSSAAMLGLLDTVRAERAAGAAVVVLAFDIPDGPGPAPAGETRDQAMAARLGEARRAAPARTIVALTGNVHSRRVIGTAWDPAFRPLGWWLVEAHGVAGLVTLDVRLLGGSAWVCTMDDAQKMTCGAMASPAEPVERTWWIDRTPTGTGHDGSYVVGPMTASPPAAR